MGCGSSLPPDARMITYHSLLSTVNTGDLLLFSGKGMLSGLIRFGSLGFNWSHVGIIIVMSDERGQRIPYVIESNPPTGFRDMITGRFDKSGPQMINLADRLRSYEGHFVALRSLTQMNQSPILDTVRIDYQRKLLEFIRRQPPDSKYDYNPIVFWGALSRSNTDSSRDYFCTEFAAAGLLYAKILQPAQPCENFTLDDFSSIGYLPTWGYLSYSRELYLQLPV